MSKHLFILQRGKLFSPWKKLLQVFEQYLLITAIKVGDHDCFQLALPDRYSLPRLNDHVSIYAIYVDCSPSSWTLFDFDDQLAVNRQDYRSEFEG